MANLSTDGIIKRLKRDNFEEVCKFSKKAVVYDKERDGDKPPPLTQIIKEDAIKNAILYFKKRGEPLTVEDFVAGPKFYEKPIYQMLQKGSWLSFFNEQAKECGQKVIDRDLVLSTPENVEAFLYSAILCSSLKYLNTILQSTGKGLTKEDLFSEEIANPPLLWVAAKFGRIGGVQAFLEKNGETLTDDDMSIKKYGRTPLEIALDKPRFFPNEMVEKKLIFFKKEHFLNADGSKKDFVKDILVSSTAFNALELFQQEGIAISREEALSSTKENDNFNLLARMAYDGKKFNVLADVVNLNGEGLKREDFIASFGFSGYKDDHIILRAVVGGGITAINKYLESRGESNLTIADLPADCPKIYNHHKPLDHFEKLFGIAGFSDNPKDIATFFAKIPSDKKTKAMGDLVSNIESLNKIISLGGKSIKREDFVTYFGDENKKHTVMTAVLSGNIVAINKYLKQAQENVLTLADLPADFTEIYSTKSAFQKILGIEGFSDKPKDLKDFWERMPLSEKTKEREKIYKKELQKAVAKSISVHRHLNRGR